MEIKKLFTFFWGLNLLKGYLMRVNGMAEMT